MYQSYLHFRSSEVTGFCWFRPQSLGCFFFRCGCRCFVIGIAEVVAIIQLSPLLRYEFLTSLVDME